MARTNSEIAKLRAELQHLSERLAEISGDSLDELNDNAHSFFEKGADVLKEKWEETQEITGKTGKRIHEYAKENPWQMLGIGATLGFVIALLLNRDND